MNRQLNIHITVLAICDAIISIVLLGLCIGEYGIDSISSGIFMLLLLKIAKHMTTVLIAILYQVPIGVELFLYGVVSLVNVIIFSVAMIISAETYKAQMPILFGAMLYHGITSGLFLIISICVCGRPNVRAPVVPYIVAADAPPPEHVV